MQVWSFVKYCMVTRAASLAAQQRFEMDDCNLKSLTVKPGQLSPKFCKDVTDYKVTVGSQIDKITLLCETSDRGASYSISVSANA